MNINEMTTQHIISQMLVIQDSLNKHIHPEWDSQGWDWDLAIMAECGEILERWQGWKWWKKAPDISELSEYERFQLALEFIDVLHFCLSRHIDKYGYFFDNDVNNNLSHFYRYPVANAIKAPGVLPIMGALYTHFGYDERDVYRLYLAKNALNQFRQEMGSKEGTYNKIWGCNEDNHYLMWAFNSLKNETLNSSQLIESIKESLLKDYQNLGLL